MSHIRISRVALAACAVAIGVLMPAAGGAQASTVTVGSVFPAGFASQPFGQVQTQFNTTLPEKGANLTSPVDGVIVRWRVQGAVGGPFYLRVLHPTGSGAYEATQISAGTSPAGPGLQTFTTNLPVNSGDLVGVDPTSATDEIGVASVPSAGFGFIFPPPFNGSTVAPSGTEAGKEIELSAEVQPKPKVISLEDFSGSIAGGTKVTVNGDSLTGASEVRFGDLPAASFTVESDSKITAVAPRSAKAGYVDVTVKTAAGTSETARPDRFFYEACVVPKLKGKTLGAGRKALTRAGCKLGKVKGPRKGKVKTQSPGRGKVKLPGSRVSVKLVR
jgi:IPT/TIG domain-containing protein/PASTA domain-containing protein